MTGREVYLLYKLYTGVHLGFSVYACYLGMFIKLFDTRHPSMQPSYLGQ